MGPGKYERVHLESLTFTNPRASEGLRIKKGGLHSCHLVSPRTAKASIAATSSRSAPAGLFGPDACRNCCVWKPAKPRNQRAARQTQGQRRHHALAGRRPRHHRHVGPQARAPEEIRGEFKPITDQRPPACRSANTCRRPAEVMRQGHPRPLAGPHHSVARPGHGLHDHRQQADAGAAISRRSARWRRG